MWAGHHQALQVALQRRDAESWPSETAEHDESENDLNVWVDGTIQETPTPYTNTYTEGSFFIAKQDASVDLDGRVACVIAYNKILSAGEISQLSTWISDTYGLTGP